MKSLGVLMAAAALAAFGVAAAAEQSQVPAGFLVVRENAEIPFARTIDGWEEVDNDHVLLDAGIHRLYLAKVWPECAREARYHNRLGVEHRGTPNVDRFSTLIIDGRRCPITELTQVERVPTAAHRNNRNNGY